MNRQEESKAEERDDDEINQADADGRRGNGRTERS